MSLTEPEEEELALDLIFKLGQCIQYLIIMIQIAERFGVPVEQEREGF